MDCPLGGKQTINKIHYIYNQKKQINKNTLYTAKELIYWSSKNSGNELVFDTLLDIHDDVQTFLKSNNLNIKTDKELFLMKLLLFVYDNTAS